MMLIQGLDNSAACAPLYDEGVHLTQKVTVVSVLLVY